MSTKRTGTAIAPAARSMWLQDDAPQLSLANLGGQVTKREERVIQHARTQAQSIQQSGQKGRFADALFGLAVDDAQTIYTGTTYRMFHRAQDAVARSMLRAGFEEDFDYAMRTGARTFTELLRDGLVEILQTTKARMVAEVGQDPRPPDPPLNPLERWWYKRDRNDWDVR